MSTSRRKSEVSKKDVSDMVHTPNRARQKRGSTSQIPSSLLDNHEDNVQCNGLSTSTRKTPKSHSVSASSSFGVGGQRRSARLSHIDSQQMSPTLDNKKRKNDGQKKDRQRSASNTLEDGECEKYSKRSTGKLKNVLDIPMKDQNKDDELEEEPIEKRVKKNNRRKVQKEVNAEERSQGDKYLENESEAVKSNLAESSKQNMKRNSKRQSNAAHQNTDKTTPDCDVLQQDPVSNISKRKKSLSSNLSSNLEKSSVIEVHVHQDNTELVRSSTSKSDVKSDANTTNSGTRNKINENDVFCKSTVLEKDSKLIKNDVCESLSTLSSEIMNCNVKSPKQNFESNSVLKKEKITKDKMLVKSFSSPNKDDLVSEYNRSISEKISLLKPKAFVGRSSATFRKTVDEQGDGSGQEVDSDAESRRAIMKSAQRRIEQNLSTSESDSRLFRGIHTPVAHNSKNDSSESDSAPEAVSFVSGRQEAMETIKSAAEHVKREKQRIKERRKARLEMLKQQKEEKLIRLKEKMASQEDASCSSSEESGYEEEIRNARLKLKKKKSKSKSQRTEKENLDEGTGQVSVKAPSGAASGDSSDEDFNAPKEAASLSSLKRVQADIFQSTNDAIQSSKVQQVGNSSNRSMPDDKFRKKYNKAIKFDDMDKKDRGFKSLTSLDYIPLSTEGATKFMVVPLDKAMRTSKSLAEKAADFRQKALYGSRIKREPGKAVTLYKQKIIAGRTNFLSR